MIMDREQAKEFFRTETDGIAQILIAHREVLDAFVDFVYDRSPDVALASSPRFTDEEDEIPTVILTTKEKP